MKTFIKILRWIWEFPQCLLGFILTKIYDVDYSETYKGIDIYKGKFPGHTRQSLRWGWLYLLTVGIVSFTWCSLRYTIPGWKYKDYYSIWPENKADEYGGVKRN